MRATLLTVILALMALSATGQRLTRPKAKVKTVEAVQSAPAIDTLPAENVRITGYDKPLRSRRESMIVTNCGKEPFDSVRLTMTYTDDRGTLLNTRTITVAAHLHPGQAKSVSIRSWDVNNSYYYFLTPPTRAAGTPFRLSVSALPIRCK